MSGFVVGPNGLVYVHDTYKWLECGVCPMYIFVYKYTKSTQRPRKVSEDKQDFPHYFLRKLAIPDSWK